MTSAAPDPATDPATENAALRAALVAAEAEIEHLKLQIAKLRRERYGQSSERGNQLLDQLELQLDQLETAAAEDAGQGETDDGDTTVRAFTRRKPKRAPLPADLPRERVVLPSPEACPCCGWRGSGEAGRGRDGDPGAGAPSVEGGADGAGEVQLPGLRGHHAAAGTAPRDPARARRACWRRSSTISLPCICRSPGRAGPWPPKASRSTSRPWPTG